MTKLNDYVQEYQLTLEMRQYMIDKENELPDLLEDPRMKKPITKAVALEIIKLQKGYLAHLETVNHYNTSVAVREGFFKDAVGKVVRPYPNQYNHSVYVQFMHDRDMLAPVLLDIALLEALAEKPE